MLWAQGQVAGAADRCPTVSIDDREGAFAPGGRFGKRLLHPIDEAFPGLGRVGKGGQILPDVGVLTGGEQALLVLCRQRLDHDQLALLTRGQLRPDAHESTPVVRRPALGLV